MSQQDQDRLTKQSPDEKSRMKTGHNEDVEFSEESADQEDWEALERSERADARQEGHLNL